MHIIKVGLDYQVAPLEIRERITFSNEEMEKAMKLLNEREPILENVILSTCNRTEIVAVVKDVDCGIHSVQQFIKDWFHLQEDDFIPYFRNLEKNDAIEHLFLLATGLDSMVIGETQILGQVRTAFLTAQENKVTGRLLNELFKRVITFAKKAHKETAIGEHAVSVSYVAVELLKEVYGTIDQQHVVILGAGEMGALTLKHLQASGIQHVSVVNRTFARAEELAEPFAAEALPIEQLDQVLGKADILVSSTGSHEPIIDKKMLHPLHEQRDGKPLCLVDIAVPRDIDPSVAELKAVSLYDVDDLQGVIDNNLATRKAAADVIASQVAAEVTAFNEWVAMLETVPVIQALQKKSHEIQERTLQSMYRKIPDLTEREMKVLQKHTSSILHQILREPIETVKDLSKKEQPEQDLQLFKHIFGLEVSE